MSLASFWSDYSDRVKERTVRAWQLLTTQAPGNSGKIAALEYLNSVGTPLTGIDLSPPDPEDNGTPDDLSDDPAGAFLVQVDLRNAKLYRANLGGANLSDAGLRSAILLDADLRSAISLQQEQLDHACGDENTKLPEGLTIRLCDQYQPAGRDALSSPP